MLRVPTGSYNPSVLQNLAIDRNKTYIIIQYTSTDTTTTATDNDNSNNNDDK